MADVLPAHLLRLTPQERTVVVLRDVMGWDLADVAELLDLRLEAANCVLLRARAELGDVTLERAWFV